MASTARVYHATLLYSVRKYLSFTCNQYNSIFFLYFNFTRKIRHFYTCLVLQRYIQLRIQQLDGQYIKDNSMILFFSLSFFIAKPIQYLNFRGSRSLTGSGTTQQQEKEVISYISIKSGKVFLGYINDVTRCS